MNPNFRFGKLNRITLMSISRAIAPIEIGIEALDTYVLEQIEAQVRQFPRFHRLGFCLGLYFIELGAFVGGWGLVPFSLLSRKRATKRLYRMLHSRITPVRLLINGLRVLVCLSAYGHTEVERWFGFERRAWRKQRIATRKALIARSDNSQTLDSLTPPIPNPLFNLKDQRSVDLLSWESHQALSNLEGQNQTQASIEPKSPFKIDHYVVDADNSSHHQTESQEE